MDVPNGKVVQDGETTSDDSNQNAASIGSPPVGKETSADELAHAKEEPVSQNDSNTNTCHDGDTRQVNGSLNTNAVSKSLDTNPNHTHSNGTVIDTTGANAVVTGEEGLTGGEEPGEETPMDGKSGGKSKKRLTGTSLRDLNTKQRHLLIALCILYFALYALLSLIGPFFPIEAEKKGLSPFETGIVISTSWLVMFLMAPLVGILGTKLKLYYLTTGGVAAAGLVSITLGFLQFLNHREAFLALALVLRILEGIAVATFCVTAWSVLIATMGDCIQMTMAVLMAVQGVAVIVSPLIGGVLYEAGGFITPFASLGVIVVLSTPLSWWVMKKVPDCGKADIGSVKNFVSNIAVFLTALFITVFSLTFKFLESYVALYIKDKFDYGPQMAGIILSLACLSFIITAVIWAQVIRLIGCVPVMVMGSVLAIIVMTFIAPGHFIHFEAHPWQVFCMTCLFGVAFAASQAPAVPRLLELARKRKMPESYLTYGLVSACYNSAFDLGCFTGPLIGGTMYSYLGFPWSTFSLGVLVTIIGGLILAHYLWESHWEKKKKVAPPEETPTEKAALTPDESLTPNGDIEPIERQEKKRPSLVELSPGVVFAAP